MDFFSPAHHSFTACFTVFVQFVVALLYLTAVVVLGFVHRWSSPTVRIWQDKGRRKAVTDFVQKNNAAAKARVSSNTPLLLHTVNDVEETLEDRIIVRPVASSHRKNRGKGHTEAHLLFVFCFCFCFKVFSRFAWYSHFFISDLGNVVIPQLNVIPFRVELEKFIARGRELRPGNKVLSDNIVNVMGPGDMQALDEPKLFYFLDASSGRGKTQLAESIEVPVVYIPLAHGQTIYKPFRSLRIGLFRALKKDWRMF